eukprot:s5500_g3.t1
MGGTASNLLPRPFEDEKIVLEVAELLRILAAAEWSQRGYTDISTDLPTTVFAFRARKSSCWFQPAGVDSQFVFPAVVLQFLGGEGHPEAPQSTTLAQKLGGPGSRSSGDHRLRALSEAHELDKPGQVLGEVLRAKCSRLALSREAFQAGLGLHGAAVAEAVAGVATRPKTSKFACIALEHAAAATSLVLALWGYCSDSTGLLLGLLPEASSVPSSLVSFLGCRRRTVLEPALALALLARVVPVFLLMEATSVRVLAVLSCVAWLLRLPSFAEAKPDRSLGKGPTEWLGRQWTVSALLVGLSIRRSVDAGERRAVETAQEPCRLMIHDDPSSVPEPVIYDVTDFLQDDSCAWIAWCRQLKWEASTLIALARAIAPSTSTSWYRLSTMPFAIACVVLLTSQAVALTETQPPMARPTSGQLDHFSPKAKGAVKEASNVVKETVKELDETVILAEHKAEELIHHKPPPPRRFRPWLLGTLGFAAVLGVVATRRWAARHRGPAMAGTRRSRRNTPTIPAVVPSRESVLQRTPSQSSLTPIKVHKVEFQRVGVQDGAEWDSPDEQDAESPQVSEWEPGMGKLNPKTEYYQINSQQDTITCKQEARNFAALLRCFAAEDHPGGPAPLRRLAGQDATDAFVAVGHSEAARRLLQSFEMRPSEGRLGLAARAARAARAAQSTSHPEEYDLTQEPAGVWDSLRRLLVLTASVFLLLGMQTALSDGHELEAPAPAPALLGMGVAAAMAQLFFWGALPAPASG